MMNNLRAPTFKQPCDDAINIELIRIGHHTKKIALDIEITNWSVFTPFYSKYIKGSS